MKARFWLNLGLLLSGIGAAVSGLTLQIKYHWDYPTWLLLHEVTSVLLVVLVTWHLVLNWKWLRVVWTKRLLHKHKQLTSMSLVFVASAFTGMGAWTLGSMSMSIHAERPVIEIHDKLTLFLCGFVFLHVWDRKSRLAIPWRARA
jgi:hypothetical protein